MKTTIFEVQSTDFESNLFYLKFRLTRNQTRCTRQTYDSDLSFQHFICFGYLAAELCEIETMKVDEAGNGTDQLTFVIKKQVEGKTMVLTKQLFVLMLSK